MGVFVNVVAFSAAIADIKDVRYIRIGEEKLGKEIQTGACTEKKSSD